MITPPPSEGGPTAELFFSLTRCDPGPPANFVPGPSQGYVPGNHQAGRDEEERLGLLRYLPAVRQLLVVIAKKLNVTDADFRIEEGQSMSTLGAVGQQQ